MSNRIYVARDENRELCIFVGKPRWNDQDGYWSPKGYFLDIPRDLFPSVRPGKCAMLRLLRERSNRRFQKKKETT